MKQSTDCSQEIIQKRRTQLKDRHSATLKTPSSIMKPIESIVIWQRPSKSVTTTNIVLLSQMNAETINNEETPSSPNPNQKSASLFY